MESTFKPVIVMTQPIPASTKFFSAVGKIYIGYHGAKFVYTIYKEYKKDRNKQESKSPSINIVDCQS